MSQRIVVIGAGIIGAAIAWNLARAGHRVTVVDKTGPATGASGRSFGWINASFFADASHFRLRAEGIAAWKRAQVGAVTWSGALWFEETGEALHKTHNQLAELGYPVEAVEKHTFMGLEPHIATPPEMALKFPVEGAADTVQATATFLARALASGAQALWGAEVAGVATRNTAVVGVDTPAGLIPADHVVVAAGTGSPSLLQHVGVTLPLVPRPGVLVTTRPVAPVISHILVAPGQELRQLPDGRLLAPTSPNHQSDEASHITDVIPNLTRETLSRVNGLLSEVNAIEESTSLAMRPVPQDGLPVIGPCGVDGLYVATMHSGVTLAALVGERVADEITQARQSDLLDPYRPDRFQT